MSSFWTDPWAGSGDLGLGSDITAADIGPNSDGTYTVPVTAAPLNDPANTAGNPSVTSVSGLDVLKFGTGILQTVGNWDLGKSMLDYKRYEATQGGLYRQGYAVRTSTGQVVQSNVTFGAMLLIVLLLVAHHNG